MQELTACDSQVLLEHSPAFREYRQKIFSLGSICILDVKMNCVNLCFHFSLFSILDLEDNWNNCFKGHREVLNLSSDPEVRFK